MAGEQLAWCAAPFGRLHVFMAGPAFDMASAANEHGYVRKGLRFGGVAGRNMPWLGASRPESSGRAGPLGAQAARIISYIWLCWTTLSRPFPELKNISL